MTVSRKWDYLIIPLIAILVFSLFGSCADPKTKENSAASPSVAESAPVDENTGDTGDAAFSDESPEPLDLPAPGSVSFGKDDSLSAAGEYLNDGTDLTLRVTDSGGLTWTLTIPAFALKEPERIVMVPLKDLSGDIPGSIAGGVQLLPDGLRFYKPAVLTVSGDALKGTTVLLSGNSDGSEMDFAVPGEEEASAYLFHFSTAIADNVEDSQIGDMRTAAEAQYKKLRDEANEVLKKDIPAPVPPSMPIVCVPKSEAEANSAKFAEFINAFNNPEGDLVRRMLAAQQQLQLLGNDADYLTEQALISRMVQKADLLIKDYGNDPEKLPAIGWVALQAATDSQLLGLPDEASERLIEEVAALYEQAIETLFKKLTEEHEYRVTKSILEAAHAVALLSDKTALTFDGVCKRLEKALHFDLTVNYTLKIEQVTYVIEAESTISFNAANPDVHTLRGTGDGSLVSYRDEDDPRITVQAPDFKVQATAGDFKPYVGTATISLDRFFPGMESFYGDGQLILTGGVTEMNTWAVFYDYVGFDDVLESTVYSFPVSLSNGKVDAVDETVKAETDDGGIGILDLKLTHSPRGK